RQHGVDLRVRAPVWVVDLDVCPVERAQPERLFEVVPAGLGQRGVVAVVHQDDGVRPGEVGFGDHAGTMAREVDAAAAGDLLNVVGGGTVALGVKAGGADLAAGDCALGEAGGDVGAAADVAVAEDQDPAGVREP